jgi:carbamoyltransferase
LRELIDLRDDGSFALNPRYFDFAGKHRLTTRAFERLFDGPPRAPESPLTQREMDLARSVQEVTEEAVLRLGRSIAAATGMRRLCLAGGVALNCVANGRLLREGPFSDLWIQPAAGDADGAVGAALAVWHRRLGNPRPSRSRDAMKSALLGPAFDDAAIAGELDAFKAVYQKIDGEEAPSTRPRGSSPTAR